MPGWSIVTTKGRVLMNVCLVFADDEITVLGAKPEPGEEVAFLIDQLNSRAHLNAPFKECQRLALLHRCEIHVPRNVGETFISYIERVLCLMTYIKQPLHERSSSSSADMNAE